MLNLGIVQRWQYVGIVVNCAVYHMEHLWTFLAVINDMGFPSLVYLVFVRTVLHVFGCCVGCIGSPV